jgi:hypothetical protein
MALAPMSSDDRTAIGLADSGVVQGALGTLALRQVPPWLRAANPFQDGAPPKAKAAFHAVAAQDLIEIIAVRGPLHAVDGWCYLGQALNALLAGQPHAARHLAYYAELRAALSILASAGIGIFNRRNVVVDATGGLHPLGDAGTHDMAWAALSEWASLPHSLEHLITPVRFAGTSIMEPVLEFFPSGAAMAGGALMLEWGFDLQQGAVDRDERNWSSYQPTSFSALSTSPANDMQFLRMFWTALRPNGVGLERHLLRILLEAEARGQGLELSDYEHRFDRLDDAIKALVPFSFLRRIDEPVDHDFIVEVARSGVPAHPYSMASRAGLLLKIATGVAEANLAAAGIQPAIHFEDWWRQFGVDHGLWEPSSPPEEHEDLWLDIEEALDDAEPEQPYNRRAWIATHSLSARRLCEAERAALWGLLR